MSQLGPPADTAPPFVILVVDDERNIRRAMRLILEAQGHGVLEAASAEEACRVLAEARAPVDLVLLDLMLPGKSGLDWLADLRRDELARELPVIVVSGHASSEEAAQAMKLGAVDFFEKPLNRERILVSVTAALRGATLAREVVRLRADSGARSELLGSSTAMRRVHHEIERVAPTKASVLITGPSGTGKELVSRAIHALSSRCDKLFIKVNCAAIPRELIESELFGHERGAFTGADAKKRGLFELAHGSTLFLDEVGDMDHAAQAKVLRVLQSGEFSRVGSEHTMQVDVRLLAATNKDLEREVSEGRFREDLFFRLAVFPLRVPTLEERPNDIPLLAETFLRTFVAENGLGPKRMRAEVLDALGRRRWPGNVRELKNVVERAAILSGEEVTIADLPEDPHVDPFLEEAPSAPRGTASGRPTLREVRERAERDHIIAVLEEHDWNVSRAAADLGVERTNLHKKIRAYAIKRERGEPA
ncbi:MAG: sigma-54-dependent Fis family transcriptional regulator [Deltaproteobacteria bacterium]|nr:sigma-54-dependent Fis family transcriptional regulator [Deltaproteobacteria bacterium]